MANLCLYAHRHAQARGQEDGGGQDIMFGLSQEVGGHPGRVCCLIGDDNGLGGTGQAIDAHRPKDPALASVTNRPPGPTILSTAGTVSVPNAMAAIA